MSKALEKLVVLDFSRFIAGPFCTMLFADMGAEVIKVEKIGTGDDSRMSRPWINGVNPSFTSNNRNKKSIALNLRDARAIEILKQLLPYVDIVIENFRPGVMAKMGLSYEEIKKINPRIIMTSISGFGQDGPYRDRAAFDTIAQAEGGMTDFIMQESGGKPYLVGGFIGDYMTALYAAAATLSALHHRNRTGEGQFIDVSMLSSMASVFSVNLANYGYCGETVERHTAAPCCYARTKDGYLRINSHVQVMWERTLKIIDDPDLHQPKYMDKETRIVEEPFLCEVIERWTSQHTCEEVAQIFGEAGITVGVVRSIDMLYRDPQLNARGHIVKIDVPQVGELPFFGFPFHMSESQVEYHRAPALGEHSGEVLGKYLQMDEQQIHNLHDAGVLG